jgi:hypothetical protein
MVRGYAFNSSADFEVVRQIKEDLCYSKFNLSNFTFFTQLVDLFQKKD